MFLRSCGRAKERIVWFDIETTGFNPFKNEIIELAAVDNHGNEFNELIKPKSSISKKITEVTGITCDMVKDKQSIETIMPKFIEFLNVKDSGLTTYLIGHNSHSFDVPFIKAKCSELNIKFPHVIHLDSMRMAQYIMDDQWSHSLGALCQEFNISNTNAHRALSDVYATQVLYCNLCLLFKRKFKKCTPNLIYYKTSVLFT